MRHKQLNGKNLATAESYDKREMLSALYGQLASIKKVMDVIAMNEQRESISGNGKKLGFKLTKEEIKAMPEIIRKIFIANNFIVNYRITSNGYFEARIRRKDMYIEASGRDFETMRKRFMDRLSAYYKPLPTAQEKTEPIPEQDGKKLPYFCYYAEEWLKIKEQTTKPSTFKEYKRTFTTDLAPAIGKKRLDEITRNFLQEYLLAVFKQTPRKAQKLQLMLNCIFDMACEDFGINSPMKRVVLPYYQSKKGNALTLDEETRLVNYCKTHKEVEGTDALLVLLLFGLRKSELASIEVIDGKWLQCETSKERLGQNVVLRKIPFTAQAKKFLPYIDFDRARITNLNTISTRMKRLFPEHHPHELRHTFISRCKECGVASEVVSIWAGHSLSGTITSTVYTHYSEEFQLKEAEKVLY
mgnify:FL=1